MKILQVTPTFVPSKFGGVKTVSYNISKSLTKHGNEVTVFTTDADIGNSRLKIDQKEKIIDGFRVYYFKNFSNKFAYKYRIFLPIGMFFRLRKEITKYDLIHVHDYRHILGVFTWYYAMKHNIPYIIQAHGSLPRNEGKECIKKIFDLLLGYRILSDAKKVVAVTEIESKQYEEMGVNKLNIAIIPNGVDSFNEQDLSATCNFKMKYGIKDKNVVLYLGRLNSIKGIDDLIKAFYDLEQEIQDILLVIVGPDDGYLLELKAIIRNLNISNKVIFTGPIYGGEKIAAYKEADVVVYPSRYEIFGLVPFEAIICGTPVIVREGLGCSELIKKARCGYIFANNIDDLRNKIKYVLLNKSETVSTIRNGRKYIEMYLRWDKVVLQFEALYANSKRK